MSERKRPLVGIMTGQFSEDNTLKLVNLMTEALAGDNVDLRFYFGAVSTIILEKYALDDIGFGCHHYSLYSYCNYEAPDVLVIIFGSINVGQTHPMEIHDFVKRLPDVPIILLKEKETLSEKPGSINVNMDNYGGMKENVLHLIRQHGKKCIGYVSGTKAHSDSKERLNAYRDALIESGIPYDESLVVYGNYQSLVDDIVNELFDRHPEMDAIVSANDEMATAIYKVAEKRGRKIGEDLAVTGFDNIPVAAYMDPPLTTTLQDYKKMASVTADKIRSFLKGEKPSSEIIPAKPVIRSSCGCIQAESAREDIRDDPESSGILMTSWLSANQLHLRSMIASLIFRNLHMNTASKRDFFESLARQMSILEAKSSFVCLLNEPRDMEEGEMIYAPETLRLYMHQDRDRYVVYDDKDAPEIPYGGLRELVASRDGSVNMTNFILFYGMTQYGLLSVEISPTDVHFFETLSLEIGSALYLLNVSVLEEELRKDLEMKNQILDYAASHDHLTGILNRTGIMKEIAGIISSHDDDGELLLIMADLDHLKQINDTFGHNEGDSAIRTAVDILNRALPQGSLLGRTGGDEFTGIIKTRSDKDIDRFIAEVEKGCNVYNGFSGKDYYVNISVGFSPLKQGGGERTLLSVIQKADESLYEAKKDRRKSVLRSGGNGNG